jgi:chemotaxis protein MotB
MSNDFDPDEDSLSREQWEETVEAVEDAIDGMKAKQLPIRPAPSAERRSASHLWLVSYSDFMTIMMIFFLGLYGYTVLAKARLMKHTRTMSYSDFAAMVGKLKSSMGEGLEVQEGKGRVTLRLSDQILFASGQAELNQNAITSLAEIASSLKLLEGEIIVEGHTDNVPIHGGRFKSNWELSAARAFSVIEALNKGGVPEERMAAWGFGENRPLAGNDDEAGRAKNRRIEILVNKKGTVQENYAG